MELARDMKRFRVGALVWLGGWATGGWLALQPGPAVAEDSASLKRLFAQPPREYASAPLWVWNDRLTESQIRETLRDLAGQQVKQAFVHPRPGLMTPYLSPEWFRLWKVALDEAEKLDMNIWIYDENSYPSGFAGGWVPELMPEARGQGLHFRELEQAPKWEEGFQAVYRLEGEIVRNVSRQVRAGERLPPGRYQVAQIKRAENSPWHGNRSYVDLLKPGVTEKFIEVTLEAYKRELGGQFGKRVLGSFTDEPQIRPGGGLPWTGDLAEQFEKRWGYSLVDCLPSLARPTGDWRKVRHNYYAVLNDLFIERWAKPYYQWCETNGLAFTGHYWDHEWPHLDGVPDSMAMASWQQLPGIDCLMNQYAQNTHAQFGNVRMCRELLSVANQLGRRRTLCEIYGAGGWDLRFEDMKRIADWLAVLGVNLFDEHLSYITLRGARKRDHPQSFSYHEPWWEAYHVHAAYLARLACALSHGQQVNRVLVLEPTTTAWVFQGDASRLKRLSDSFFDLLVALETAQIEYDLGDETMLAQHGSIEKAELKVGQRTYHTVVVGPWNDNLNRRTRELLQEAWKSRPLFTATYSRLDGAAREGYRSWYDETAAEQAEGLAPAEVIRYLVNHLSARGTDDGFAIRRPKGDRGLLFHHRRKLDDGELVFLVNTSLTNRSTGLIETPCQGIEEWDLNTGRVTDYPFVKQSKGLTARYNLPPSGSLLLFLTTQPRAAGPFPAERTATLRPAGETTVRRVEPNVLPLDYVQITAGGETRTNQYFYQANQFAFQKNGLSRNPWDSAVQFKDELIRQTFPAASGFTARYRFSVAERVPAGLAVVIERPDLYTITCNGQPLQARAGDWWLDKAFGRIPLGEAARAGENVLTLTAAPMTIEHELEPVYLLGEFTLRSAPQGFVIEPDRPLLPPSGTRLGWNQQGYPFYAAGVAYRQRFDLGPLAGRYRVALPNWYGSVAKVLVNGQPAGYVTAPPWECEVTGLKPGPNEIEVVVIGTLKNTLGPHHNGPGLGSAWPAMFQHGAPGGQPPGQNYHTVAYGLFAPFELKQTTLAGP